MSKKWNLNSKEATAVFRNAVIFLAPVAITILTIVQANGTVDEMFIAVKVWALGVGLDFFRKFSAGK